ncbi:hypothetical protein JCM8547_008851 [Rhodosporidiobolus lusitaniae]
MRFQTAAVPSELFFSLPSLEPELTALEQGNRFNLTQEERMQAPSLVSQTWLTENDIAGRIAKFVRVSMEQFYGNLPNDTYNRIFRRQIEQYHPTIKVGGGSNTHQDPFRLEVPGILIPAIRLRLSANDQFGGFAVPVDFPMTASVATVPAPAVLMSHGRREGTFLSTGVQAYEAGQLNRRAMPQHIEINNGGGLWKGLPVTARPSPLHGRMVSEDVAVWEFCTTIHDFRTNREEPLIAKVGFRTTNELGGELLHLCQLNELGSAGLLYVPGERQGPPRIPVILPPPVRSAPPPQPNLWDQYGR